jgi:hypothetical protein
MADKRKASKSGTPLRSSKRVSPALGVHGVLAAPSFYFKDAADITGVDFHQGEPALDGRWLNLFVNFATHSSPEGTDWKIWPHEAAFRLSKQGGQYQLPLGTFKTYLSESIRPTGNAHKSGTASVSFRRLFTPLEIAALEEWRDGRDLDVKILIYGYGQKGSVATWDYFNDYSSTIPRSKWLDMLAQAHLQDKVLLAVPVAGEGRLTEAGKYLRSAIEHHARGEYSAAGQTCRKALEEIGTAGFGLKAPKEVRDFVHHTDPKSYTLEQRVAIIVMAAKMLYNSASHAGEEERDWRRVDADLAMAVTAALLRSAPLRLASAVSNSVDDIGSHS